MGFLDFLGIRERQVSMYLRPAKYLFAILERTRRCVVIGISCVRFPCTWPICSTRCFEYLRAFRRNRTVHNWRTCRDRDGQVHRFDFATILSSPFCSCILIAIVFGQLAELKFWAQQRAEMADVKQIKKIGHVWNYLRSICLQVGCLVSTHLTWILGSRLILSNNQSRATLWVLDTCLIVGLRPLMIIIITASLSSEMCSIAPNRANFAFDGTHATLFRLKMSCWVGTLVLLWVCLFDVVSRDKFPCTWPFCVVELDWWRVEHF